MDSWHQGWAGIHVPAHSQEWKPLIPVPKLWKWTFSLPSCSRILGMLLFVPLPFLKFGNVFFSFPSCSKVVGMVFYSRMLGTFLFHSLPLPQLQGWNYPFLSPFPNSRSPLFDVLESVLNIMSDRILEIIPHSESGSGRVGVLKYLFYSQVFPGIPG